MSNIEVSYASTIQPSGVLQVELHPLIHTKSESEETIELEEHLETVKYIEPESTSNSGGGKTDMSSAPSWNDAINSLMTAAATIISEIGNVIAQNAGLIASVLVLGAIAVSAIMVARRVLPGISSFFKGIF